MATEEVKNRSKLSLENCLPSMSPQWLKSLLLGNPEKLVLPFSKGLKQKINNNPQKYLRLLMVTTLYMFSDTFTLKNVMNLTKGV